MFPQTAPAPRRVGGLALTCSSLALACTMATSAMAAGTMSDFGKDLDRTTSLHHFQVDNEKYIGQRFEFNCPAKTVRDTDPAIHGTDVYPANTPICVAAQHAGVVGAAGGPIMLQLNPGVAEYQGTRRNDVQSRDLPGTKLSIRFMSEATRAELDAIQHEWKPRLKWDDRFSRTGLANIRLTGQRFAFDCPSAPANVGNRAIYGTDAYALNSLVCLAAVHAGQLTMAGGPALVQMDPALEGQFVGSIRHGIESRTGAMTTRSITFPGGAANGSVATATSPAVLEVEVALPAKQEIKGVLKKSARSLLN